MMSCLISVPRKKMSVPRKKLAAAALLATAALMATELAAPAASHAAGASAAPGAPGVTSYFDLARKDCVGTARNSTSKVWFTVADGVLSDVYEPTIDNTNVKTLQYVVTDGSSFTDLQTRDMTYSVATDATGMSCTITSISATHGYQLVTTYIADPERDAVLMHTQLTGKNIKKLQLYAYLDAHVNGNGGGGADNGGADSGTVDASGVGVVGDAATVSQATNRDYAVPTYMALSSPQLQQATVGYAGGASDGLAQLDGGHALSAVYDSAPDGHIVLTEQLRRNGTSSGAYDLSLGFGRNQAEAISTATPKRSFAASLVSYLAGWARYDNGLTAPHAKIPGLSTSQAVRSYYLSANVLKASEDKTFPGAVVASLASPWGQAVSA